MLYNDPYRIGSDAWRERHAGAEPPVPMTVTSSRDQLNQPPQQSAPQGPSFESEAHAALVRIAGKFNDHIDQVDHDAIDPLTGRIELDAKLKQAHAAFVDTDDFRGIDTVEQLAAQKVAEKKQRREEIRKSLVKEGDQAAETRATRRWESDRDLLNAQGGSLELGRQLIEAADDIELSVLCEQLPNYYRTKGIDATPVINAAVTRRCPELAAADSDLRRAEMNRAVLRVDAADRGGGRMLGRPPLACRNMPAAPGAAGGGSCCAIPPSGERRRMKSPDAG
jgi:hypothetical protein